MIVRTAGPMMIGVKAQTWSLIASPLGLSSRGRQGRSARGCRNSMPNGHGTKAVGRCHASGTHECPGQGHRGAIGRKRAAPVPVLWNERGPFLCLILNLTHRSSSVDIHAAVKLAAVLVLAEEGKECRETASPARPLFRLIVRGVQPSVAISTSMSRQFSGANRSMSTLDHVASPTAQG